MSDLTRILLVDDHFTVRLGLAASLDLEGDLRVVAQAGSGGAARREFRSHEVDLVIMDWRLPDIEGPDLIRELKGERSAVRFLVLSAFEGEENVYQAMEAGADGYVSKSVEAEEVLAAVRQVANGAQYLSGDLERRLQQRRGRESLSPRETDVLRGLVAGRSNKEIADELSLAEITVKQHVSKILQKLGVQDRTQAVLACIQ